MKSGLFMGSSLAPILVERVLDTIIDETLMKIDFLTPFWFSYVDDHLTAVPENKIQEIIDVLHTYDSNIKFTYEFENERRLDYLDITIHRDENGKLTTNWYCKPIASNRLLNFYSNHPSKMKFNVAKSFIRKVFRVSHKSFWYENLTKIREILRKNNYPNLLINKLIKEVRHCKARSGTESYAYLSFNKTSNVTRNNQNQSKQFASLAYVPGLSEKISKSCKAFVPDVQFAMKPHDKNDRLFSKLKSKIPIDEKSGLVYKIDCKHCNAVYIGETIQKLATRKYQHQCDCKKQITKTSSALAIHAKENDHTFDFDNAKILKQENNKLKLQIHEVNQIIRYENNTCNKKTDKKDYTNTYINLIKNMKK